jgi:hypothetical protein
MQRMNDRPTRNLGLSRRELFETIERDALVALLPDDWEFAEWRRARVNLDYGETAGAPPLTPIPNGEGKAAAEMPLIAVARALLTALAQTEEVSAEATQRHRMTQLQVAYGNALIAARGFGAPQATEAFARAGVRNPSVKRSWRTIKADAGVGRKAVDRQACGKFRD